MGEVRIDIGILYLCIHKKLDEKCNRSRVMYKKDFFTMLGKTFHVPKPAKIIVLKEMEEYGMIKDLGQGRNYNIEVLPLFCDPEHDVHEFYKKMKLF